MRARAVLVSLLVVVAAMVSAQPVQATIYVSMEGQVVATWEDDANGDVAPTTTITGASTNLNTPYGIDVDSNYIYVANQSRQGITVYPIDGNGDLAPVRQISGSSTRLSGVEGIAVDGNWIYVTSSNRIVVFPLDADGDVAPAREISGTTTTLSSPRKIDVDGDWIYVADPGDNSIKSFPIDAAGNVPPARTIVGASTLLSGHYALAVGSGWIYATSYGIAGAPPYNVLVFPNDASGDVAPTRRIEGAATTLNQPYGIEVDSDWIYVANYNAQSVVVFPIDADGDVPPARTIAGPSTPFDEWPSGIAVSAPQVSASGIPAMSPWGGMMLILLIGFGAIWLMRRTAVAA